MTQSGIIFKTKTVVLTSGTFLGGRIHIGLQNYTGGRAGDPASIRLSERLRDYELPVGRLKPELHRELMGGRLILASLKNSG